MPPKPDAKAKPAFPAPAATLPGEADILATVVADLSDDTARLVYADWLDERDDSRGQLLRDSLAAFRAGKKLPALKGVPKPWCDVVGLTLLTKAKAAGLIDHADTFLRLARPALTIKSAKAPDAKLAVGASKFGGRPDLPPAQKWPRYDGEELAFLGQFNLAELAASFVCRELPQSGVLSVFYLTDDEDDRGEDPPGTYRLFHFPDTAKLARRDPPEELPEPRRFKPCGLTFTEVLTLPDPDSPWRRDLKLGKDDAVWDAYQEKVAGYGLGHQILGYPSPLQSDVLGKKTMRHLVTIDSDDGPRGPGWMWGDSGLLYFSIGEENLKAGKFDKARLEMQCC